MQAVKALCGGMRAIAMPKKPELAAIPNYPWIKTYSSPGAGCERMPDGTYTDYSAACGSFLAIAAPRQAHGKDRSLPRLARHRDIATHHARELAADRKTETGTAEALRCRGIGLAELLEQLRLLL